MLAFQSTFDDLLQSWQLRLQDAEARETDWPARLETCIRICEESLLELRQWVIKSSFPGKDCEIYFFKQVKPVVMARYIYYSKIYRLHIGYFNGSGLLKKERLEKELHYIARYFTDNEDFYTYYRKGDTHHDEMYFIRGQYDWRICPEVNHFDNIFSTSGDGKLAELMACELLMKYIDGMLNPSLKLTEPATTTASRPAAADTLQCTASIADIVELGYALHATGFFNDGKASIKDIMHLLSATLKVNLGKFYDTSIQLRERKNPTQFLDGLKASLIRYFNQFEETL